MHSTRSKNRTTGRATRPLAALALGVLVSTLAACTTSVPVSVQGLRETAGGSVPGARGETVEDQDKIDEHVARMCAAQVYSRDECALHTRASAERRDELAEQRADLGAV